MEKFTEDKANTIVNEGLLEKEFHIDTSERRRQEILEIRSMRNELEKAIANTPDPDKILLENIDRANSLLDIAQRAIENGGETSARMYEVCAQLINAITSATSSISGNSFNQMKHEQSMEALRIKEREIDVKEIIAREKIGQKTGQGKKGNVIVMDRESLLKMMEDEDREVVIESSSGE